MAGAYTTAGRVVLRFPVAGRDGTEGTASLHFWSERADRQTAADLPRCERMARRELARRGLTPLGPARIEWA